MRWESTPLLAPWPSQVIITDKNTLCKCVETTSRAVGIRKAGRYPTPFGGIDVKQQSLKNSTQLSKKLDFKCHVLKVKADESCQ